MSSQSISNRLTVQRERLIKHLKLNGSITTAKAREELAIMHPAGRIKELRGKGYLIETHRINDADISGTIHKQALYVLLTCDEGLGAAQIN